MKKLIFGSLAALLLFPAFQAQSQDTPSKDQHITVYDNVLKMADWAKFEYKTVLDSAKTGSTTAIKKFLEFHAVVDGADALNHGVTCLELIPVATDVQFASAALACKSKLRKIVLDRLILAQGRTQKEQFRKSMTEWAPATWAVLNGLPYDIGPKEKPGMKLDAEITTPESTSATLTPQNMQPAANEMVAPQSSSPSLTPQTMPRDTTAGKKQ